MRCPIFSVGSIEPDGILYGLMAKAWIVRAKNSATATIMTSSIDDRSCFDFTRSTVVTSSGTETRKRGGRGGVRAPSGGEQRFRRGSTSAQALIKREHEPLRVLVGDGDDGGDHR